MAAEDRKMPVDLVGEMILWSGDPQPGRVWRIAEISQSDHNFIIIPGSFTGSDRVTIPFKDAHPLPTSPHSPHYEQGDDSINDLASIDEDKSVCESLAAVRPDIFANGGDRHVGEIPESAVCREHGIELADGLGAKIRSSSDLTGLKEKK